MSTLRDAPCVSLSVAFTELLILSTLVHTMRKIERLMNEAISEGLNWKSGNTKVVTDGDNVSTVYLHGNMIARVGENYLQLFDGGWQSVTTKSRLNAICTAHAIDGEGVFQKQGAWFVRVWNNSTKELNTEAFYSGFMLADL